MLLYSYTDSWSCRQDVAHSILGLVLQYGMQCLVLCRLMEMPRMIIARTAGAAKKQLIIRSRPASGLAPDRSVGHPLEVNLVTGAGTDAQSTRRATGISTGTVQHRKKEAAGRNLTGGKRAELSSLILSVQRTGTSLEMADLIRIKTATGTIAVRVIQAGTITVMRGAIAEILLTASVAGLTDMTVPLLKVNSVTKSPCMPIE